MPYYAFEITVGALVARKKIGAVGGGACAETSPQTALLNYLNSVRKVMNYFLKYFGLPGWLRVPLAVLFSSILGSTVLAFLSTYATYWYAFRYGARIPVEGVPFLPLAIAVISFVLLISSTLLLPILYFFLDELVQIAQAKTKLQKRSAAILVSSIFSVLGVFFADYISKNGLGFEYAKRWVAEHSFGEIWEIAQSNFYIVFSVAYVGLYVVIFLSTVVFLNRRNLELFMGILYLVVLFRLSASLFAGRTFDSFLRMARFGGGIGVEISIKNLRGVDNITFGQLFIITETSVIYFDSAKNKFFEIPRNGVNSISYPVQPSWALPPSNPQRQWDYFYPS